MIKNFKDKNILLIDDDETMHLLIKENLEGTNSNLLSAYNGYDGLKLYKENDIDLVILDIHMPGINGYETLVKLKQIDENSEVIMCSSDSNLIEEAYDLGAIAYISKPINFEYLSNLMEVIFKLPKLV